MRYSYTHFKVVKPRLKKLRYLSNQNLTAEIGFCAFLSGTKAGLLPTLAYSHPYCSVCSDHCFFLPSRMPQLHQIYLNPIQTVNPREKFPPLS